MADAAAQQWDSSIGHLSLTHMQVLYEDNHIIIVNKAPGEIVQGDKTGDTPLSETVKAYLKEKYSKPGNVFLGVAHRLDRPVSGVVVFAKTSKALSRLCDMFRNGKVKKTYHALLPTADLKRPITEQPLELEHHLLKNEKQNKSYVRPAGTPGAKQARLDVRRIAQSDRYTLVEVHLHTGRHHQIRCQLSASLAPIKGDVKYGDRRSNPDASICLHAREITFTHPVSQNPIHITAPYPSLPLWQVFE